MMLVSAIARLNTWELEQSLYVNFLSFKTKQHPDHVDSFSVLKELSLLCSF